MGASPQGGKAIGEMGAGSEHHEAAPIEDGASPLDLHGAGGPVLEAGGDAAGVFGEELRGTREIARGDRIANGFGNGHLYC